jgi:hypothetical protein
MWYAVIHCDMSLYQVSFIFPQAFRKSYKDNTFCPKTTSEMWDCIYPLQFAHFNLFVPSLIDYLRFYVPLKNISLIWRRQHYLWRAAKFRSILGAQGLSLSCHTCCDTGRRFFLSHPKDRPIQSPLTTYEGGCGGSILTRILTGFKFNSNPPNIYKLWRQSIMYKKNNSEFKGQNSLKINGRGSIPSISIQSYRSYLTYTSVNVSWFYNNLVKWQNFSNKIS